MFAVHIHCISYVERMYSQQNFDTRQTIMDYLPTTTEQLDKGDFDDDTMNLTREILKAYVDEEGLRTFFDEGGIPNDAFY